MIVDRFSLWFDQLVQDWRPAGGEPDLSDSKVFRFRCGYGDKPPVRDIIKAFLEYDVTTETEAIIIGMDEDFTYDHSSEPIINLLAENSNRLPNLKGLYIGEIEQEESELSWINNCDMTPLLNAYAGLEELRIRGGTGLAFKPSRHICLKKLVIETGGLNKSVLAALVESVFPELEHLELWLPFPKLNYLDKKLHPPK